jgi:hypothetical protein
MFPVILLFYRGDVHLSNRARVSEQENSAVLAYGLAALVSASRISGRQHFASDVVVGGAMGWFIGTYVFHTHQHASRSQRSAIKTILSPQVSANVQPGDHSYGLSLAWRP